MAGKSAFLEALILDLLFKATTDATLASAAGSATNLYVSLHTADPGDAGTQATNEVTTAQYGAYTGAVRPAVARSGSGWARTNSTINPVAAINFPTTTSSGTGCTATHFGIGMNATVGNAGNLLYSGAITPNIVIPATTAGVIPQLTTTTAISEG